MIPLTDRVFRGYVTYSADKENEVSKIFIIHVSLGLNRGGTHQFKQT